MATPNDNKDAPTDDLAKLIGEFVKPSQPAIISGNGLDISFGTRIIAVKDKLVHVANTVPFNLISSFVKSNQFWIQVDLLRIHSDKLESDGKNFIFHTTKVDSISETRGDERFGFSSDENVRCEFTNPEDEETIMVKPVLDMSASGFSLRTAINSQLLKPGRKISKVKILIGDKLYSEHEAEAVYQRRFMDENGKLHQQVGLKFTMVKPNDKT